MPDARRRFREILASPRITVLPGVLTVSYPRTLTSAALQGMRNALEAFGPTVDAAQPTLRPDPLAPFEEINRLMGLDRLDELEARYAGDPGR